LTASSTTGFGYDVGQTDTFNSHEAATSLLRWWADAGVDAVVGDVPYDWLSIGKPVKPSGVPDQPVAVRVRTLLELTNHFMTGDIPEAGPPSRRITPSGDPTSDLMILVDFPDAADVDTKTLLSDPIFDKMLVALGRDRSSIYIASLCPGRPMTGRIAEDSLEELAPLARQHIGMIGPKQLWLMGTAASRAILGISDAEAKGNLHHVNHDGITMDVIATAHPRMFDGSKSRKAAAWAEMQRLILREDV
jgi:uracil-DNA glycosylase